MLADYIEDESELDFYVPTKEELKFYRLRQRHITFQSAMFVRHSKQYSNALSLLRPDDVVFEAGAGDFKLAYRASKKVEKVYAIELNPQLIVKGLREIGWELPTNLIVMCGDWFEMPIPEDVTVILLLVNNAVRPKHWQKHRIIYLPTGVFNPNEP